MIVNLKTAKVLGSTLKCRPLLGRAAIEQLTNDDYPDARLWQIVLQKFQNALRLISARKPNNHNRRSMCPQARQSWSS
jgi:hypothetical protein